MGTALISEAGRHRHRQRQGVRRGGKTLTGILGQVVGFLVIKIISSANKGPKGDPLEEPSQGAGFPFFAQSAPGEPVRSHLSHSLLREA